MQPYLASIYRQENTLYWLVVVSSFKKYHLVRETNNDGQKGDVHLYIELLPHCKMADKKKVNQGESRDMPNCYNLRVTCADPSFNFIFLLIYLFFFSLQFCASYTDSLQ